MLYKNREEERKKNHSNISVIRIVNTSVGGLSKKAKKTPLNHQNMHDHLHWSVICCLFAVFWKLSFNRGIQLINECGQRLGRG